MRRAALAAVEPCHGVQQHVHRDGTQLLVDGQCYDLRHYERVLVIGAGKAAAPMAAAITDILNERLSAGVMVVPYGHDRHLASSIQHPAPSIQYIEAGHPVPDESSVRGAEAVAALASQATERDLVLCLISGGGSALLTLPVPGLELAGVQALTDALLRSGAPIHEVNVVRKHCSRIKGGNLARLAAPATLVTLILSDVVGDPLDVIASGPTAPDPTTVADAEAIVERRAVRIGAPIPFRETPKPGDRVFEQVQHVIVGSNLQAAMAAEETARRMGFNALLLSTHVEGEAREVAKVAAALAKSVRAHGIPLAPPACLIWGGETTVTVRGKGAGGRNQELALAAAVALDGWQDTLVMALATDGIDGPTDAAGAIATGETVGRARALGLDPQAALAANDSYPFFAALGDLLQTGPTGTNVNDLLLLLIGEESHC